MTGAVLLASCFFPLLLATVGGLLPQKEDTCGCCSGPPGIPGNHGNHGLPGSLGPTGSKGERGDKGDIGVTGPQGPTGEKGKKGSRGRKGDKGSCGPRGEKGLKGHQGIMGPTGPKGEKGFKGEKAVGPKQIAFFVSRTSKFMSVEQDSTIEFDKIFLNTGDAFSAEKSHFICSTNGTYQFSVNILSQEDKDAFVMVMLNDQPQIPLHGDHRSGYGVASNTFIFRLVQGDHVSLRLKKGSAISNDSSTFSGYLLFED